MIVICPLDTSCVSIWKNANWEIETEAGTWKQDGLIKAKPIGITPE